MTCQPQLLDGVLPVAAGLGVRHLVHQLHLVLLVVDVEGLRLATLRPGGAFVADIVQILRCARHNSFGGAADVLPGAVGIVYPVVVLVDGLPAEPADSVD